MTPAEIAAFRTQFFRSLTMEALEPDDERYVALYELEELKDNDPVELLKFAIDANDPPTVQLLSGFRGTGKSTELRRLRKSLKESEHVVLLFDIDDYINPAQPVDPVDFLLAFALGVAYSAREQSPSLDPLDEGYWARIKNFLTRTEVEIPELSTGAKITADVGAAKVEANAGAKIALKDNPSFVEKARKRWQSQLGQLAGEARSFIQSLSAELLKGKPDTTRLIILVDSIEHIRGSSQDAEAVQSSVERLFTAHADLLHFPGAHVVFTVHPYLKIKYPNLGDLFSPGGVQLIPTLKVREQRDPNHAEREGAPRKAALDAIHQVIEKRGPYWKLLGAGDEGRRRLDRLSLLSGGHLRDLMRLLAEITRRGRDLPVTDSVFNAAIAQVRNEAATIADDDALWLADIAKSSQTCLPSQDKLPTLARFLDTHQVLCYRNGHEWFDVHPLIRDVVIQQAADVLKRRHALASVTGITSG